MWKQLNNHRKLTSFVLAMIIVFTMACPAFAEEIDTVNIDYDEIWDAEERLQQEIDALFEELNTLAAKENFYAEITAMANQAMVVSGYAEKSAAQRESIDAKLAALGVLKIDPNNSEQIERLEEIILGASNDPYVQSAAAISDSTKPDLGNLAGMYDLYQFDGRQNINGTLYEFTYITVVDRKGACRLTLGKDCTLVPQGKYTLGDLADYTFSFVLDQFKGLVITNWFADWAIGAVHDAFVTNSPEAIVAVETNNQDMYGVTMRSVTQMRYLYIYLPTGGWVLCGVYAPDIEFGRMDYINANVDGHAVVSPTSIYPVTHSSTGSTVKSYMQNYVDGNGCIYHEIGTMDITSEDDDGNVVISTTFRPVFVRSPLLLL